MKNTPSSRRTIRFSTSIWADDESESSDLDPFAKHIASAIRRRDELKVIEGSRDVTPILLESDEYVDQFQDLNRKFKLKPKRKETKSFALDVRRSIASIALKDRRMSMGPMKANLEDIIETISASSFFVDEMSSMLRRTDSEENQSKKEPKQSPYIKVNLRETDEIVLFEQSSLTVLKNSDEAKAVEEDNRVYDFLTTGKGRNRRRAEAETQTAEVLYKTRDVNTETIRKLNVASYVSNFDMFDTYKDLEKETTKVNVGDEKTLNITTYKVDGVDQFVEISESENFKLAAMLTQRILAGNVFKEKQRRFRNMFLPDPLSMDIKYLYSLNKLWKFRFQIPNNERRAVSAMSWCPTNGDILAVAYGVYTVVHNSFSKTGYVAIWSIKNPVNPERVYEYSVPVVSVEFSPFVPQLLAIGLFDGSVEVRDITSESGYPVAISERLTSPGCEPVNQIKWLKLTSDEDEEFDPFLAISQNGYVMKYRIVNSPNLLGFKQMKLDRVEGMPEGLPIKRQFGGIESNRNPQGLGLTIHPTKHDLYFAFTDEGCLHKCSTNYPHQHMELLQVHDGGVSSMEYSPWSPKLFLTAGNDWCIRIWLEGIFKPLITLSSGVGPVHCANWSPTHSTVIVGVTRKAVEIWDIRRSILKPVSSTKLCKANLTMESFSNCGRSIAIGNEKGRVILCSFEDMPFPAHFQYEELEAAISKGIRASSDLTEEVKSIGSFAYPKCAKKPRKVAVQGNLV